MTPLPQPRRYFPITRERYEVAANMALLGRGVLEAPEDALHFQFDTEFPRYRDGKVAARAEQLDKYVGEQGFTPEVAVAVTRWMRHRLCEEHPQWFQQSGADQSLVCRLTGETLHFASEGALAGVTSTAAPPYRDAFDALCAQVQEDIAVVRVVNGEDRVCAVHVCNPSGWRPAEKLGLTFPEVHAPVPGIEPINRKSPSLMQAAVERGPFVRFGWGIAGTARLNQHPDPPPGLEGSWRSPAFNPIDPENPFYLRGERQVLAGLPEVQAFVFLIRVSLIPASEILANAEWRRQLLAALQSLSPESAIYKGIAPCREPLTGYLAAPTG